MSATLDVDDLPIVAGAVAGLLAWVVGYALTYVLVAADIRESALNQFARAFGDGDATYELVGWVFFNSHLVDAVIDVGFFGSRTANFVGGEDGFSVLLYAIPAVILVAAGLAVGRSRGVAGANDGAVAGALVVPGYLVFCVVGAVLFRVEAGGASGEPELLPAVLLAGVVYPLVFGAVGGVVAAVTTDEEPAGRRSTS